uniref:Uncharacterized protein n=1 Tax=Arundo donax TaxID=35708 RepID=A0A0A9F5Q4_ARUDO
MFGTERLCCCCCSAGSLHLTVHVHLKQPLNLMLLIFLLKVQYIIVLCTSLNSYYKSKYMYFLFQSFHFYHVILSDSDVSLLCLFS